MASLLLGAYIVASIVNLAACLATDLGVAPALAASVFWYSKPTLMPLLSFWLFATTGRRSPKDFPLALVHGALFFGLVGDVALLYPGTTAFMAGMGAFGVGHVLYIIAYSRGISFGEHFQARRLVFVLPLAFYGYIAYAKIHPYIPPGIRLPLLGYIVLLLSNGFVAFIRRVVVEAPSSVSMMVGAILFVQSDSIIALNKFQQEGVTMPLAGTAIMLTYVIAQFMIANGGVLRLKELEAS